MIPAAVLAALKDVSPWRKVALGLAGALLLLLLCGLAAWRGYAAGFAKAEALGRAEVSRLEAAQAQALAKAEALARQRLAEEAARAADIERQFLAAKRNLRAARLEITNRRIADVSRDVASDPAGRCLFPDGWVRLYNEALGVRDRADAVPTPAPGAPGTAGAGPAPGPGVLPGPAGAAAVTPEDILAHARDYGGRCQALEAQLRALIRWAEGRGGR